MSQEQDIIAMVIESLRSAFGSSPIFRYLLLFAIAGFVLSNFWRLINRLVYPTRFSAPWLKKKKKKNQVSEAEAEATCCFHCDCEDCKSYESGKFCPRCDRFESCAYCSFREHCDL